MSLPQTPSPMCLESASVKQLHEQLSSSLQQRVLDIPLPPSNKQEDARVAVLFSGGLDCTVLARLASDLVPPEQLIDLLNVAFENPRIAAQNSALTRDELYELCPDRITGRKSFAELVAACPGRRWRLVAVSQCCFCPKQTADNFRSTFLTRRPVNTDQKSSVSFIPTIRRWTSQ